MLIEFLIHPVHIGHQALVLAFILDVEILQVLVIAR